MPQPEGHRRHAPLHGLLIQPGRHVLTQRVVSRVHPHPERLILSDLLDHREQIDPQPRRRRHRTGPPQQQFDITRLDPFRHDGINAMQRSILDGCPCSRLLTC